MRHSGDRVASVSALAVFNLFAFLSFSYVLVVSKCIPMKFELNYVDGRIGDQSESRKAKKVKLCHRVSDRQGASDQSYRGDRFRFFRGTSKFLAYGVGQ